MLSTNRVASTARPAQPQQRLSRTCSRCFRKPLVSADSRMKVVVTGAGGKTGGLIVKKLLQRKPDYEVRAALRSRKGANKLVEEGLPEASVFEVDITAGVSLAMQTAVEGQDALIIATSGVPQIKYLSMLPVIWAKITGKEGVRPDFSWKGGQLPEQVDWLGQKAQIDAAKAAGIKRVVLISSMGGTDPDHPLNKLGNGNILQWKRKAEQYLVASGLTYTIIHPGGLIDEEGGKRQLVVGIDDTLLERTQRSIPRADVAELAVQCLSLPQAENRSFDVVTEKPGEGVVTSDWVGLLAGLQGSCDYSINSQLQPAEASA